MNRKWRLMVAVLCGIVFVVGFVQAVTAQETIKIGASFALSGSYAEVGLAQKHGIEQAAEDINVNGILVGGKKYKVEPIIYDDKFVAAEAAVAIRRLVFEDKVKFMVGPFVDELLMPIADIMTQNKVINIIDGAGRVFIGGKTFLGPQNPYVFKAYSDYWEYNPGIYDWLVKAYPKVKKCAGFARHVVYTDDWLLSARKAAEAHGLEWVTDVIYEPGTTDFYPVVTKLIKAGVDHIYMSAQTTGDGVLIFKALADLGWKRGAPVVRGGKFGLDSVLRRVDPKILEGAYSFDLAGSVLEKYCPPRQREIYHKLTAKWPQSTLDFMMWGYNQTYNLCTSIEKANSFDPDIVAKTIENSTWPMTEGDAYFSGLKTFGLKRQTVQDYALCTVKDGKMEFAAWVKCKLE
jgi:branched-chain amino acid transport system substrate-binding protein